MDTALLSGLKADLHQRCLELLASKIVELTRMQTELLEGALDDSKSSAGDKHETARAMMQLEQEKLAGQLQDLLDQQQQLIRFDPSLSDGVIRPGSLVQTDRMLFYLTVGLGKLRMETTECMVLSPSSPLGKRMNGLSAGDRCEVNGQVYHILAVV